MAKGALIHGTGGLSPSYEAKGNIVSATHCRAWAAGLNNR